MRMLKIIFILTYLCIITLSDPIKNFGCKFFNFENFTCTFEVEPDKMGSEYFVTYILYPPNSPENTCDVKNCSNEISTWRTCEVKEFTFTDLYFFTVKNSKNETLLNQTEINHYANTILLPPNFFHRTNVTSNSVQLDWQLAYDTEYNSALKQISLDYEINFLSKCENFNVSSNMGKIGKKNKTYIHHQDLKFANTEYFCKLRIKTKQAPNENWSDWEWISHNFTTSKDKPNSPPDVDRSTFYQTKNELIIYWKKISDCSKGSGSDDISYNISYSKDIFNLTANSSTWAKFKVLKSFESDQEFTIKSQNTFGLSENSSKIVIPAQSKRIPHPRKILLKNLNETVQVSWEADENGYEAIKSFTVLWCQNMEECDESFDYKNISSHERSYNITRNSNKSINVALAAVSENSTSGLVWYPCREFTPNGIGKVQDLIILKNFYSVNVSWSIPCEYENIINGYYVMNCDIINKICVNYTTNNSYQYISNLDSNTEYNLTVRGINLNGTHGPATSETYFTKSTDNIWYFGLGVLIILVLIIICIYCIIKKIKHSSGIKVVFPPGLEDIHSLPVIKPKEEISEVNEEEIVEDNFETVDAIKEEELVSEEIELKPISQDKVENQILLESGNYITMPSRQTDPRYIPMAQMSRNTRTTVQVNPPLASANLGYVPVDSLKSTVS